MPFSPLSSLLGLFSHDIGIDLGTANTLVMVKGRGIVIDEPSVVAIDRISKKILAIGAEAKRMVGRTPANIIAVRPLKDGVISDFDVTERMLQYFIRAVHDRFGFGIPRPRARSSDGLHPRRPAEPREGVAHLDPLRAIVEEDVELRRAVDGTGDVR